MKSTPMRGVKETLKPDAYKQSERARLRRTRSYLRYRPLAYLSAFCVGISSVEVACVKRPQVARSAVGQIKTRLTFGEPVTAYLLHNGSASWSCEQA